VAAVVTESKSSAKTCEKLPYDPRSVPIAAENTGTFDEFTTVNDAPADALEVIR